SMSDPPSSLVIRPWSFVLRPWSFVLSPSLLAPGFVRLSRGFQHDGPRDTGQRTKDRGPKTKDGFPTTDTNRPVGTNTKTHGWERPQPWLPLGASPHPRPSPARGEGEINLAPFPTTGHKPSGGYQYQIPTVGKGTNRGYPAWDARLCAYRQHGRVARARPYERG